MTKLCNNSDLLLNLYKFWYWNGAFINSRRLGASRHEYPLEVINDTDKHENRPL
ncbi:hypothetical protein [Carboxylicivirga taeanensis]|uniref:hypothetical protein n=1 Tax=Carboxylicivirga taeanensis TaxID=1416875 RepID=UPI003F6E39C4